MRVVTPDELAEHERQQEISQSLDAERDFDTGQLAGFVRGQWEMMRRHRSTFQGWNLRLLKAQRVQKGEYDPEKLQQIQQFGGSTVYARVIAAKCRGATSLLREVYLGPEKPWGLDPTDDPVLPDNVNDSIDKLVQTEIQNQIRLGGTPDVDKIKQRTEELAHQAKMAGKKKARDEAVKAEDRLNTILEEGEFYQSLAEVLSDIPLYPFGCLKGPVVRMVPTVQWVNGEAVEQVIPRMFWSRCSPFDIFWSPGVSRIKDADICERKRLTRTDLNDVLDLPGYNQENIRAVLDLYGNGGLRDWLDPTDAERAWHENKENPVFNQNRLIECLEYHGHVQGRLLIDYGMPREQIPDELRDYMVQVWVVGQFVIKVQLSPSPRKRHPYFVTSFEKVPGAILGNGLPDILEDVGDVCNAALRALVNNLSIASGPQVVVNDDRIAPGADNNEMYPWKRWHVNNDPANANNAEKPVDFFQPNSNANELLVVYEKFTQIADELSAIPRYVTGSDRMGGAGRTASGLAMLMGNAGKLLQTVAANIDRDIMEPGLQELYDLIMLTDESRIFRGDESIVVRGVEVAVQRETNRQRQLEFLQTTANPIDAPIMGLKGRAQVLRTVAHTIGIDGDSIVPSDDDLEQQQLQAQQAAQNAAQAAQGQPGQGPAPIQAAAPQSRPRGSQKALGGIPMQAAKPAGQSPLGTELGNQSRQMLPH